jgi:hypothetical protein
MIVLSHRGYWKQADEKNGETAFRRSFELGFGTETDVRDCRGELLISHDMPQGTEMTLEQFLRLQQGLSLPLAINIKSDGLAARLAEAMHRNQVADWFVFDMSVPDMRAYLAAGMPVFTRLSDVEPTPAYLERAAGVWLDMFDRQWYDNGVIEALLGQGKRVCVVSAELHGKEPGAQWQMLRSLAHRDQLILCTDEPELARDYFRVAA